MRLIRLVTRFDIFDNGVEPAVFVGRVLDDSFGTIGFDNGVFTLDFVSISGLPLTLDVVSVQVVDGVVVMVLGMSLQHHRLFYLTATKVMFSGLIERIRKRTRESLKRLENTIIPTHLIRIQLQLFFLQRKTTHLSVSKIRS
jgi:hypothetical protein